MQFTTMTTEALFIEDFNKLNLTIIVQLKSSSFKEQQSSVILLEKNTNLTVEETTDMPFFVLQT